MRYWLAGEKSPEGGRNGFFVVSKPPAKREVKSARKVAREADRSRSSAFIIVVPGADSPLLVSTVRELLEGVRS